MSLRSRLPGRPHTTVARHVATKAWRNRGSGGVLRRALVDLVGLEGALRVFGSDAMITDGGRYYPLAFLPAYHGPHFHRAIRRLLVPGLGPFVAHVSLTGACPWTCKYCFASAGGPQAPDVGDDALVAIAHALAKQGVPIVILGGGEPLTRFQRALTLTRILSASSEVRLATSGIGLTAARAAALTEAGLSVLAISLDGHDRARVDAVRGEGAFDQALRALSVARDAGLVTLVTCVVGRGSFPDEGDVDKLLALIRSVHPKAVVNFLPEFATGRGAEGGFRTPLAYAATAARVSGAIRTGRHRAAAFYAEPMDAIVGCVGAAQRQVVVDTSGNLNACVSGASFGNLLDEPFEDVWKRMLDAPARFKQGYFCAHVHEPERAGDDVDAALRGFHRDVPDAGFQRAIDALGPMIPWLVPAGRG